MMEIASKVPMANGGDAYGREVPHAAAGAEAAAPAKPRKQHNQEGDHDSGVDETTQEKEDKPQVNGAGPTSPKDKGPKGQDTAAGRKSRAPAEHQKKRTPNPTGSNNSSVERKNVQGVRRKTSQESAQAAEPKVPMNKISVGHSASPNLKNVRSKIGSMSNANYKPGGGNVKIESRKLNFEAKSRVGAKNEAYVPGGGDKKVFGARRRKQHAERPDIPKPVAATT